MSGVVIASLGIAGEAVWFPPTFLGGLGGCSGLPIDAVRATYLPCAPVLSCPALPCLVLHNLQPERGIVDK